MKETSPVRRLAAKPEFDHLVFVYGTLKTGFCRNHHLSGCACLGEFRTRPVYRLYDCGEYPAMVMDPADGRSIEGEIWAVDESVLAVLDRIEAVAEGLYRRVSLAMSVESDLEISDALVQGYLYNHSVEGLPDCGCHWNKVEKL